MWKMMARSFQDRRLCSLLPWSFTRRKNNFYFSTELGHFTEPCSKFEISLSYVYIYIYIYRQPAYWNFSENTGSWRVLIRILSFPASEHFGVTSNSAWEQEHLLDARFSSTPFAILFLPLSLVSFSRRLIRETLRATGANRRTILPTTEKLRNRGWRKNCEGEREVVVAVWKCFLGWINGRRMLEARRDATFLKFKLVGEKRRRKDPLINIDERLLY